jgi:hypothetical protein
MIGAEAFLKASSDPEIRKLAQAVIEAYKNADSGIVKLKPSKTFAREDLRLKP